MKTLLSGIVTVLLVSGAFAAPTNDDFASAVALTSQVPVTGTTVLASAELNEPGHGGSAAVNSVWYNVTVPAGQSLDLVLTPAAHARFSVYQGDSLGSLSLVADTSFASAGLATPLLIENFLFEAITYRVAVDGVFGPGAFTLSATVAPPPANDNFNAAVAIAGAGAVSGTTFAATVEPGEPGDPSARSVWYNLVVQPGKVAILDLTCSFPAQLTGFTGDTLDTLVPVAQNLDISPGTGGGIELPNNSATPVTFRIQVDGGYYAYGAFSLGVNLVSPPANDNFANRIALTPAVLANGNNLGATVETDEPLNGGFDAQNSVWYSLQVGAGLTATLTVKQTSADVSVAVFTGADLAGLVDVTSSDVAAPGDEVLTFSNTTGSSVSYSIAVDTFARAGGSFSLNAVVAAPEIAGTLAFASSSSSTAESGTKSITVTRSGGSLGAVSVAYTLAGVTATAGSDFTATGGTVNFDNGVTSATIEVPIADDTVVEADETFTVTLSAPTGGATLGATTVHTVTITNDDSVVAGAGTLSFSGGFSSVGESAGTHTVTVSRTGGSTGEVSVTVSRTLVFSSGASAAVNGEDFAVTTGTLVFADGVTSKVITIDVFDDNTVEGNETFGLRLSAPSGGATLGVIDSQTVTILDNDPNAVSAGAGTFRFAVKSGNIAEEIAGGIKTVEVQRVGGTTGSVTVAYAILPDSTATVGNDVTLNSGVLTFADGVSSQTISIAIDNDTEAETSESFTVALSSPTGGAVLGTPNLYVATITDDETNGAGAPQKAGYIGTLIGGFSESSLRGSIQFTRTEAGIISGKFVSGGKTRAFKGPLVNGSFTKVYNEKLNLQPIVRTLSISLNQGGNAFSGQWDSGTNSVALSGGKKLVGTTLLPVPQTGYYTARFTGSDIIAGGGEVRSPLVLTVSRNGAVKLKGVLSDGTAVSVGTAVVVGSKIPVGATIYKLKNGSLVGNLNVVTTGTRLNMNGTLSWCAPAAGTLIYPTGFNNAALAVDARLYTKPLLGQRVVETFEAGSGLAQLVITGGGLLAPGITKQATLSVANKVVITDVGLDRAALKINPNNGTVSGSFIDVAAGSKKRTFSGVVLQSELPGLPAFIQGQFRTPTAPGVFRLNPL